MSAAESKSGAPSFIRERYAAKCTQWNTEMAVVLCEVQLLERQAVRQCTTPAVRNSPRYSNVFDAWCEILAMAWSQLLAAARRHPSLSNDFAAVPGGDKAIENDCLVMGTNIDTIQKRIRHLRKR
ncbi:MAG: hypothetical protein KGL39_21030 [Patescibacteria group bacterium]|nr:hypothetical protein [Patescibacteria group bacterium]